VTVLACFPRDGSALRFLYGLTATDPAILAIGAGVLARQEPVCAYLR
jgi:hypothetical protein